MQPLNGMPECWTVNFFKNVGANLDDVVRAHSQEKSIEGRVVQPAERQPVSHNRLTAWFGVRNDVGRIQQLAMPEATEGALIAVGMKYALAEHSLVNALARNRRDVSATSVGYLSGALLRRSQDINLGRVVYYD